MATPYCIDLSKEIMDTSPSQLTSDSPHISPTDFPIGRLPRILLAVWCLLLTIVLTIAAWLRPDPRGFGTHQGLGLPPCTFRATLDIPCPSCGFTTSFSHFVRGQFAESARANPAGLGLALLCAIQVPWAGISCWQGRLWRISNPERAFLIALVTTVTGMLLVWGYRLIDYF